MMMDLKERIARAENAIAKVEAELALLHRESQELQRQQQVSPSSMDAKAIALAARQATALQAEVQPKLSGIRAAVESLQPVLAGYQRELAGLRQLQKEAQQLEAEKLARLKLQQTGEQLNKLSEQLASALLQTHLAGEALNKTRGLGDSIKYELAFDFVPVFAKWGSGFRVESQQVKSPNQMLSP